MSLYQVVCLAFLSVEDQLAHFLQMLVCLRAVVILGASAPERLLVQLQLLGVGSAIDHSTHV